MKKLPSVSLRVIVATLALFGLFGVLPVSLTELSAGGACPHLGVLPACHLVSAAYVVIFLTVLHYRLWNPVVFLSAWLAIFALAAIGSGLELAGHEACPTTEGGIPKCYFSLGLALALFMPFLIHLMTSTSSALPRR